MKEWNFHFEWINLKTPEVFYLKQSYEITNSCFLIFKDCVTSSFIPVKPFDVTAQAAPTVEVEEFVYDSAKHCRPYRVYKNQIYVYPKHLKYDSQKCFNKVRYVSKILSSLSPIFRPCKDRFLKVRIQIAIVHHFGNGNDLKKMLNKGQWWVSP